jgi:hypothetical protein
MRDDQALHDRLALHLWRTREIHSIRKYDSDVLKGMQIDAAGISVFVPEASIHPVQLAHDGGTWSELSPEARHVLLDANAAASCWMIIMQAGLGDSIAHLDFENPRFRSTTVMKSFPGPFDSAPWLFRRRIEVPLLDTIASVMGQILADRLTAVIDAQNESCARFFEPWEDVIATSTKNGVLVEGLGGHSVILYGSAEASYRAWRDRTIDMALTGGSMLLPGPTVMTGNARLTRALALCHRALEIDPDLTDASGTPLRPLLTKHVPDMLAKHRNAAATAAPEDVDGIDDELEAGVARVCRAIEQGLSLVADKTRDDLRAQILFLENRHPDVLAADGEDESGHAPAPLGRAA